MRWAGLEAGAYWIAFAAAFLLVAIWESFRPERQPGAPLPRRWSRHGILILVSTVASVAILRVSPVLLAWKLEGSRYGLLNKPWAPFAVRFLLALIILDFIRYAGHWCMHRFHFLWRVHQVHHCDPDFDTTTAARFHPLEIVLIQGANLAAIALLAAPPAAVLVAEVAMGIQGFFVHANAIVPAWIEKPLRRAMITPDLHRIHHSSNVGDQYCNLGEILCCWDRLFHTYAGRSAEGTRMGIGMKEYPDEKPLGVGFLLLLPFRRERQAATADLPQAGA